MICYAALLISIITAAYFRCHAIAAIAIAMICCHADTPIRHAAIDADTSPPAMILLRAIFRHFDAP